MSPGLGSTALTAGKDREGLVPAKTQLHDRRGSQPLPTTLSNRAFAGVQTWSWRLSRGSIQENIRAII